MIKMIVAWDKNKVIGNKDKLPWRIKSELEHFKKTTMGDTLLFGKTTFEGLPKKLPGRKSFVLSPEDVKNADKIINNENELLKIFKKYNSSNETLWISGGKSIYEKYFNYASEILVSEIKDSYEGDVKLNINLSNWNKEKIADYEKFSVIKYSKK